MPRRDASSDWPERSAIRRVLCYGTGLAGGGSFANETERVAYLEKQGYLMAQHTSRLHGNMVRVPIYMWNVLGSGLPSATVLVRKPLYQIDTDTVSTT